MVRAHHDGRVGALTKYTTTVAADHGREASARIHVESRHGRFQILEWAVLAAPNGHATTPPLVSYIVDAFIRDNGLIPQTPLAPPTQVSGTVRDGIRRGFAPTLRGRDLRPQ